MYPWLGSRPNKPENGRGMRDHYDPKWLGKISCACSFGKTETFETMT